MALVRRPSVPLSDWALTESSASSPAELESTTPSWLAIEQPTTVLGALRSLGRWSFEQLRPLDDETWWFRARAPRDAPHNVLRIGGLATLADVFVDGEHRLRSENMFHAHSLSLGGKNEKPAEIAFRFAPINVELAKKKPRPRWKTRLTSHQQLRFLRTSLVGRMPGWSPPVPPVGPWRDVVVEQASHFTIDDADVRTRIDGEHGKVSVALRLILIAPTLVTEPTATLSVGEASTSLEVTREGDDVLLLRGEITVARPRLWWPHTHGQPDRYPCRLRIGEQEQEQEIDLGHVAFRSVRLDTSNQGFSILINGVPVFCRGACWTTTDVVTLTNDAHPNIYRQTLDRVRGVGMNMLRLSGTMFYESDTFYDLCDELGILIWQDFAFANMDYPIADDEAFRASVVREANDLTDRLQSRPSVVVFCGGSEVEQQAAMFGAPREIWRGPLEEDVLPAAVTARCPDVAYWPNSPSGGGLPFHVDQGVGHYYGVGAYLRPLEDARRAGVRFASECLALANVPEDDLFPLILSGKGNDSGHAPFVSAKWKERTSKDHGSGWDFEDVRDHYTRLLFEVDPARVRYEDMSRYLQLARVTSGEVMARTMNELRAGSSASSSSSCHGALIWFLQDLWPGAGWGILDSRGAPKAPYWFLRRSLQALAMSITDEGVNGLHLHVVNDRKTKVAGVLSIVFLRGDVPVARGSSDIVVNAHGAIDIAADSLLEGFVDSSRAYRFGPPGHDLAVASLRDPESGGVLAETIHVGNFASPPPCAVSDVEEAILFQEGPVDLAVTVRTKRFLHAVSITVANHVPDENYFDMAPGSARTVTLRPIRSISPNKRAPAGTLSALNLPSEIALVLAKEGERR